MKMRGSAVVQHEFTHQWFGNLVTCSWWDYLWLNEGFARYFQYFATHLVNCVNFIIMIIVIVTTLFLCRSQVIFILFCKSSLLTSFLQARPSWRMDHLFVVEAYQTALAYDQTHRHPITASVKTPEEIEGIFDTISYSKAAAVLRMLEHITTESLFKLSLQKYLSRKK